MITSKKIDREGNLIRCGCYLIKKPAAKVYVTRHVAEAGGELWVKYDDEFLPLSKCSDDSVRDWARW